MIMRKSFMETSKQVKLEHFASRHHHTIDLLIYGACAGFVLGYVFHILVQG